MFLKENNNEIWFSDGQFHTWQRDWNYDGDVYTDTVMVIRKLSDMNIFNEIHRYDLVDFVEISEEEVVAFLYVTLNNYFTEHGEYYCDPTYAGKHYGDYWFVPGGHCIYGGDRQGAIEKEVGHVLERVRKENKVCQK